MPTVEIDVTRAAKLALDPKGDLSSLGDADLLAAAASLMSGSFEHGALPMEVQQERDLCLKSMFYYVTEVVDPFYKTHFEYEQQVYLDDVLGPYLLGEEVSFDGQTFNPRDFVGMLCLKSRDTFKSSAMAQACQWDALHAKIRRKYDARACYVHQDLDKAIAAGERQRQTARYNRKFKRLFPEFVPPAGQWDTRQEWSYPCFKAKQSGERSFTAYGEKSSKTGGHYSVRFTDDWVTEESVTTPAQLETSESRFRAMDPLRDRSRDYVPHVISGTHYHYQDTYKRIKDDGYIVYFRPAFRGPTKKFFDLLHHDIKTDDGRRKVELGIRRLEKERAADLYFPKRLSWRELYNSLRAQGPAIFNTQMLLDPMPEGQQRFSAEDLDAAWVQEIPQPDECYCYIRCDPALSEKRSNCESAIHVILVKWDGSRTFVDGFHGFEKRPTIILRRIIEFGNFWKAKGYRIQGVGVESVAFQETMNVHLREGVTARDAKFDGESVPIIKVPWPVQSIERSTQVTWHQWIMQMEGPVSRREFKVWDQNPVGASLLQRMKGFPFDRADEIDAARMGWEKTAVPSKELGSGRKLHPDIMKLLKFRKKGETVLAGTNNQVALQAWR